MAIAETLKRPAVRISFYVLTGAAIAVAFIPGVGGFFSHLIDRVKYGKQASDELEYRAKFYRNQIAQQIGVNPDKVNAHDFKLAAQYNPMLAKAYGEVVQQKDKNNRESALINTGVTAASFMGVGGIAKGMADGVTGAKVIGGAAEMASVTAGAAGGSAISGIFNKDSVNAQEIVEAMQQDLAKAKQSGSDPRRVIKPQTVFALRVAQDETFSNQIRQQFRAPFHKMNEAQQLQVMQAFPALANAATAEAYAVGNGMMPVEELMTTKPKLDGVAAKYALGQKNSSFMERIDAERQAQAVAMAPAI